MCLRLRRGPVCGAGGVMAWGRGAGKGREARRAFMLPSLTTPGGRGLIVATRNSAITRGMTP